MDVNLFAESKYMCVSCFCESYSYEGDRLDGSNSHLLECIQYDIMRNDRTDVGENNLLGFHN